MEFKSYIQATLRDLKIEKFTPIQERVLPLLLDQKNVIAISQTGTGKTLAFILAILEKIDLDVNQVQAIIVSPTRELATQINNVLQGFQKHDPRLKTHLLVGGSDFKRQMKKIETAFGQIVVATPNRLLTVLKSGVNWNLAKYLKYIVYDEVDMFIDDSFWNEFSKLKNRLIKTNATEAVFSATLHQQLIDKIRKVIKNTTVINTSQSIWVNPKIKHFLVTSRANNKFDNLEAIVNQIKPYICLIFVNKYQDIEPIAQWFANKEIKTILLHGKLLPSARRQAFKNINNLRTTYVITTDLASRGLDIDGVSHVISWNLPQDDIWYIHRSGRTSRSKYTGESYVMYDQKDEAQLKRLQNKGIIWIPLKLNKANELIRHTVVFKNQKTSKNLSPHLLKEVKRLTQGSKKQKVQPNHKKKIKEKLHKIYQKAKREAIEKKVKSNLVKGYKKQNRKKS